MIVVFDLETTGLDVDRDRIVQFAAVKLGGGNEIDSLKLLINPGVPISPEVSAVNRLTDEMVADEPSFAFYAGGILDFIGDADLCGHNMIAYDLPLLLAELKRCGRYMTLDGRRLIDTLEVFRVDCPHTLEGSLQHYRGQSLGDDAHDALADARACAKVLVEQFSQRAGPDYEAESPTLDELSALSIGDRITLDGKIVRDADGDACLSFGPHAGSKLRDVPKGFLRWMLGKDFTAETKAVVKRWV